MSGACEIHTFDYTDYSHLAPSTSKGIYFHHWGLKASYEETAESDVLRQKQTEKERQSETDKGVHWKTFEETKIELGHQGLPIDVLKIDCEGCEWKTYKDWIDADIRQLLVEVHWAPSIAQDFFQDFQNAGYVTFVSNTTVLQEFECDAI